MNKMRIPTKRNYKKNQTKILEFKNTVNKIKNLPERLSSIFKLAEI